jgi:putative thiamine transport system permease protein
VLGVHRFSLHWGLDTTGTGLWLAHTLACVPYVLMALQGPYLGFDRRLQTVSASMGHRHAVFLWRVKWPLLRSALAAAWAIGFAVSVAQYLPTLYVGAGRFQTVSTEAVTLAAGGQRSLTSAFAWLQWMLPVLAFGLAAWIGQARRWPTKAQTSAQSRP